MLNKLAQEAALMDFPWKVAALYVPVVIRAISIGVDQVQPLSLEEEKDQI